ncbi:uncharacterized protein EDB93DRAFT_1108609 [Suillus bovinus]|uniref:uncharacterized protein n=1 Tax=Suillus bovinus TaxID=48563 RepID=UPI001B865211|nr:uncharacterized protein EDB93DRAFT_1108609 [Suillus bovinus]KAG2129679.1 hypothetical protein EDB93DRAFT_1108609 [Suillus bovinus]
MLNWLTMLLIIDNLLYPRQYTTQPFVSLMMSRTNHAACMGSLPMKGQRVLTQVDMWFNLCPAQSVADPRMCCLAETIKATFICAVNKARAVLQMSELLDCSILIWPTQLGWYTKMAWSMSEVREGWIELVHPSGAIYNYNARMPIIVREKEVYPYYYVVPENHIITWVEPVDGYLLFQESMASHWNHKRLKLEVQYWKHIEYFSHEITIPLLEVRVLHTQLNWYCVVASIFWTLGQMKDITDELTIAEELAETDGSLKGPGVAICGA